MESTKSGLLEKRRAELKKLDERLDALKAESADADPELKIGFQEQLYELEEKQMQARQALEELEEADRQEVKKVGQALETALTDYATALDVAETRFD